MVSENLLYTIYIAETSQVSKIIRPASIYLDVPTSRCVEILLLDDLTFHLSPSVAKSAQHVSHAMQIVNHYHYSFLSKLIVFTGCKHANNCI